MNGLFLSSKLRAAAHERGLPLPQCRELTIREAPGERCRRAGTLMVSEIPGFILAYPVCLQCSTYYASVREMTEHDRQRWLRVEAEEAS